MKNLAGLKILIVEDEMLVSLIVEDLLADEQCIIIGPFHDVPPALEAAQTQTIDAAVLDVNINGDKIYPVAEALEKRKIPFLFLSGYGEQAIPPGRPGWIVCEKPFKAESLLSKLTQCIAARQAER